LSPEKSLQKRSHPHKPTLDDIAFAIIAADLECSAVIRRFSLLKRLYELGRKAGASARIRRLLPRSTLPSDLLCIWPLPSGLLKDDIYS